MPQSTIPLPLSLARETVTSDYWSGDWVAQWIFCISWLLHSKYHTNVPPPDSVMSHPHIAQTLPRCHLSPFSTVISLSTVSQLVLPVHPIHPSHHRSCWILLDNSPSASFWMKVLNMLPIVWNRFTLWLLSFLWSFQVLVILNHRLWQYMRLECWYMKNVRWKMHSPCDSLDDSPL